MIVVSDTTAITSLIQIGRENLLTQLYGEVLIPEAVADELQVTHPCLPKVLQIRSIHNGAEIERFLSDLDKGEAEAIVLAKECSADLLLMDEAEGRRIAIDEGLKIIGLVGLLIQAKHKGLITSVRALTDELEKVADFRVSEQVKEIIFQASGE